MTDLDLMQQLAAQRRNQFAQQSQFQAPQGQMVGRHFVAPNVLQQLAAGLRAVGGMRGQQLAEQELQDISRQRTEGTQKALADFLRQAQGTPENAPGDGMGPTLPAMAPLANPYVPFQADDPARYETGIGLVRGTIYPGLDLPFMGMVNQKQLPQSTMAQLQELENTIAELEATLANLTAQLESPFVKPAEAAKLGTEYERVQKEMDAKLGEWEKMQG